MINRPNGLLIHRLLHPSSRLLLTLLTLLSLSASASASPGFWSKIYDYPTPSVEDSPPASRHASRDKRLLPYQICGILGGYLGVVLIFLVLLLTVGRRMRRAAEMSPASLEMELMGSTSPKGFPDQTPISPASTTRSWFRAPFRKSSASFKNGSVPTSPGVGSVHSFDQSVIDMDRETRQKEMERLYAAVMEHDAQKAAQAQVASASDESEYSEEDARPQSQSQSQQPSLPSSPKQAKADKRPPRLLVKPQDTSSHNSTGSIHAIYPPTSPRSVNSGSAGGPTLHPPHMGPPMSPRNASVSSPRNVPLPMSPNRSGTPASPRSILSFSSGNKARKALKNLRISGPIKDYPGVASSDEARAPLSPRLYPDPGPPPSPPRDGVPRIASATPRSFASSEADYAYEELDKPQPLPMPRTNFSRGPLSPGLQQATMTSAQSPRSATASGDSSLPLRSYNTDAAVPPTPTKVTYLERKQHQLGLMTPRTGVPSTPYSPYMPFTPITPVTPRLMTKKEMKAKRKTEGRRVLSEDDMVPSAKDMWY